MIFNGYGNPELNGLMTITKFGYSIQLLTVAHIGYGSILVSACDWMVLKSPTL